MNCTVASATKYGISAWMCGAEQKIGADNGELPLEGAGRENVTNCGEENNR